MIQSQFFNEIDYVRALALQNEHRQKVKAGGQQVLMGLEHPLVVTLGVRGDRAVDVYGAVPTVQTDRGGQATVHNPGQLVIYPILSLKKLDLRPRDYVALLMQTTKAALAHYEVETDEAPAQTAGVFVRGRKIASIGVRISHGVTSHGIALNVNNNLEDFRWIRPCGIANQTMTSLQQELSTGPRFEVSKGRDCPSTQEVFSLWGQMFLNHLTPSQPTINLDRSLRV